MIANEFQYNLTRSQAARFEQALRDLDEPVNQALHPILARAEKDALQSQLESLRSELGDYDALRAGKKKSFLGESFDEFPRMLIEARIAAGLSQRQLADRLGLKEQQIQRYEASHYGSASLNRVRQVIDALGLKVREEASLP